MWAHGPASNAVPPVQEGVRHMRWLMIPYLSAYSTIFRFKSTTGP